MSRPNEPTSSSVQSHGDISPELAREILWDEGVLHWLLHDGQKDLYDNFAKCDQKIVVWNCSRRFGKSYTLCVIAIETCIRNPNSIVKYCCAKQVDARGIIRPLIREIIETCPKHLRPMYKTQERAYVFPNGSRIELSGLDGGRAESIRGGSATLGIIDEAGIVAELEYIVNSILLPTTTTTKGKLLLASTPPKTSTHPFVKIFLAKAKLEGNLVEKTVYDNPLIDASELQKIIDQYPDRENSISFQREYLCKIILDENYAVIPEFSLVKNEVVTEWPKPPFYDCYTSMDLGVKDLTVVLFAYFDFRNSKLVIENEFVLNGMKFNTQALADGIKKKEAETFTDKVTGEERPPLIRVSDINLTVIQDLWMLHGIRFLPTRKDDADAALNNVKLMIQQKRIIINPRCKTLINHLEAAVWNKNKTSFDRSGDNGHFDAVDSLKYLVRNVNFTKNPYPANFGVSNKDDLWSWTNKQKDVNYHTFKQIFNLKK